jgi:hypothetical protein
MARFLFDLRFALRSLTRSPLFTSVAVASLALGIGANTAIFTLIDQLMLRLLPVAQPEQLVMIWSTGPHIGSNRGPRMASYPTYLGAARGQVLVAAGLAIGIPAALAVSKYVSTQLFGVKATDIASAAAALIILPVVAAGAGFLPARRASTIDPIQALRYE